MPRIDIADVPEIPGTGYPPPFDAPCAARIRQRLGNAGGLADFGVNLMRLPPETAAGVAEAGRDETRQLTRKATEKALQHDDSFDAGQLL